MITKHFWKSYANDYTRFYLVFGVGMMVFFILTALMGRMQWFFALSYTIMDPFSYYMTGYKTVLRKEALIRKNTPPSRHV